jgi:hypothetical protein
MTTKLRWRVFKAYLRLDIARGLLAVSRRLTALSIAITPDKIEDDAG